MKKLQVQGLHHITLVGSTKQSAIDFWQGALAGDPAIIGKRIDVDGDQLHVVGVMPPNFWSQRSSPAFWRPIGLSNAEWANRGVSRRIAKLSH